MRTTSLTKCGIHYRLVLFYDYYYLFYLFIIIIIIITIIRHFVHTSQGHLLLMRCLKGLAWEIAPPLLLLQRSLGY